MTEKNPLSPHIQIYSWHISSLVSICHRITGILNISIITLVCFWICLLFFGSAKYDLVQNFLSSFFGKFFIIGTIWSFSFQILSEVRHLFWDVGIGLELKTSNVTGVIVIIGSFLTPMIIFILGKNFLL
tara:strand:- start:12638 stop:13024 length:387 start_codon:yes stop_codon:yes gene_type:complete